MSQDRRTVRCPMCGRRTVWEENRHRPFCSERCRFADLEGWLSGRYVVAGDPEESATSPEELDLTDELPPPELREKT
jgi:endogenous inhibitor of DNA gyrase (YacG/DUF329 family)